MNLTKTTKQQSNIENLLTLIKENPELEIVPMIATDVCASDDFTSWMGSWGSAKIDEVFHSEERIYFRSIDEEEVEEMFFNQLEVLNPSWSDTYLQEQAEIKAKEVQWEKVITVYIDLP
ncbi:hypothetical protein [Jeotgalibacillus haloalkalitolerans]|uniref:Uncharacterized protein n=1 Tax=Jeotgalibacillus haloalkalitolerans TaxID=3104292 RepID=A0ABU5KK34_9BACL|nr:hypothetical protein [Jeotgalibacillus sp. HH7-29]MDZ5711627.1 hypothetical protein [Jeotgalibacillus sp. HH7-29]